MEKLSVKFILVAFFIFSLGLQAITEARNVSIPCTKDSDCGSPKCKCNGPVGGRGLCVCSGDVAGLFEQAMTKTPKVQNKVP
ncbi:hypothetical protein SLE2022_061400 [Rubroshorea leprosula]